MKYSLAICCLAVSPGLFAPAASAQEEPGQRDTVEVLGLRIDQTANETGTAISLISAEDMERRGQVFVGDALAAAPGVAVSQAGALGGVSSVRIRGNAVGHTLVLIDGMPVNDAASPGGGFDFSSLDVFGVQQIEVLRGPQSTLWGSDAIGGVVSLVTSTPGREGEWGAFAEAGSYNSWRTGAHAAGGGEHVDGSFSLSAHSSDGISKADEADGNTERDGFAAFNAYGRIGAQLSDTWRVEGLGRWAAAEFDFDGFPPPNFALADSDEQAENTEQFVAGRVLADFFDGRFRNELLVSQSKIERRTLSSGTETALNEGTRTNFRYNGELQLSPGGRTLFGVEREESEADGETASTDSIFALYEWSPSERLVLTGGVRHDDDDRYGAETTGRAAVSWQAGERIRLRGTWAQGFKAPTIFQTNFICGFCGLIEPNPDLQAETSESVDVGLDVETGGGLLSLSAFDQQTENLIDFDFLQGYANIAQAEQRGLELGFTSAPLGPVRLDASYTYIDAEDGTGAALPRVPEHAGFLELSLRPEGPIRGAIIVRYNGEQSDGFGPEAPAWLRTDLTAAYAFSGQIEIYGRIENLFDEHYQQVGGYGAPGRSAYVGLRIRN